MNEEGSVIETGVDKLVNIVKERGRIALSDAARELGVSGEVIHEWVDFLEEEGIISVEYNLTKPFLVDRKLTKKEVEEKAKEFTGKKSIFIRKAQVSLSFIEKQSEDLRNLKKEFDDLKGELGIELDNARGELSELEKFQQLKQELKKEIEDQKDKTKTTIEDFISHVSREQKKYSELVEEIKKEKSELEREKKDAKSVEESEKILKSRLEDLKKTIGLMGKRISSDDLAIKNSEGHITRLNMIIEEIKKHVEEEKGNIEPMTKKSEELEKKMKQLESGIIKKISQKGPDAGQASKKMKNFFEKKLVFVNLIEKVNKDRDDLEKELIDLIKKAKSFQLSAKSADVGKQMTELEKKFNELDKKKGSFEQELNHLNSFFRK